MRHTRSLALSFVAAAGLSLVVAPVAPLDAQAKKPAVQRIDAEYTAKIKEHTTDPRIITELVDHLPASDTVPSPLKFSDAFRAHPTSSPTRRTCTATSTRSTPRRTV